MCDVIYDRTENVVLASQLYTLLRYNTLVAD